MPHVTPSKGKAMFPPLPPSTQHRKVSLKDPLPGLFHDNYERRRKKELLDLLATPKPPPPVLPLSPPPTELRAQPPPQLSSADLALPIPGPPLHSSQVFGPRFSAIEMNPRVSFFSDEPPKLDNIYPAVRDGFDDPRLGDSILNENLQKEMERLEREVRNFKMALGSEYCSGVASAPDFMHDSVQSRVEVPSASSDVSDDIQLSTARSFVDRPVFSGAAGKPTPTLSNRKTIEVAKNHLYTPVIASAQLFAESFFEEEGVLTSTPTKRKETGGPDSFIGGLALGSAKTTPSKETPTAQSTAIFSPSSAHLGVRTPVLSNNDSSPVKTLPQPPPPSSEGNRCIGKDIDLLTPHFFRPPMTAATVQRPNGSNFRIRPLMSGEKVVAPALSSSLPPFLPEEGPPATNSTPFSPRIDAFAQKIERITSLYPPSSPNPSAFQSKQGLVTGKCSPAPPLPTSQNAHTRVPSSLPNIFTAVQTAPPFVSQSEWASNPQLMGMLVRGEASELDSSVPIPPQVISALLPLMKDSATALTVALDELKQAGPTMAAPPRGNSFTPLSRSSRSVSSGLQSSLGPTTSKLSASKNDTTARGNRALSFLKPSTTTTPKTPHLTSIPTSRDILRRNTSVQNLPVGTAFSAEPPWGPPPPSC